MPGSGIVGDEVRTTGADHTCENLQVTRADNRRWHLVAALQVHGRGLEGRLPDFVGAGTVIRGMTSAEQMRIGVRGIDTD